MCRCVLRPAGGIEIAQSQPNSIVYSIVMWPSSIRSSAAAALIRDLSELLSMALNVNPAATLVNTSDAAHVAFHVDTFGARLYLPHMQVSSALKSWAKHHGISKERAAASFGVTSRTWQRWTEAKGEPSPSQLGLAEAEFPGLLSRIFPAPQSDADAG